MDGFPGDGPWPDLDEDEDVEVMGMDDVGQLAQFLAAGLKKWWTTEAKAAVMLHLV